MKATIKRKWVSALRSGRYKQTKARLYRRMQEGDQPPGHCCLGVLRVVVTGRNIGNGSACWLSEKFLARCGLTDKAQGKLSEMNDYRDMSFKQIAAYIERHL